jgi:hypothetical protein
MKYLSRWSVAGLPFELSVPRASIARFCTTYFKGYETTADPCFSITLGACTCSMPPRRIVPELVSYNEGVWNVATAGLERRTTGLIDEKDCACRIDGCMHHSMYGLTAMVRICIQFFLERQQGFFLHAACGAVEGKGIAFTGKSTAGKSTGLRNASPDRIVAEDAVALRITNGIPYMYAIPFRGERSYSMPLSAVLFPRKSEATPCLVRESTTSVITELTANALVAAPSDALLMNRVLGTIADYAELLPGYSCYFAKTTNLLPLIRQHVVFN